MPGRSWSMQRRTSGRQRFLQQLDARARHFVLVTELQPHNEHTLVLIGDLLLTQSPEKQLVLVVHLAQSDTPARGPFVPVNGRVLRTAECQLSTHLL